MYRVLACDLPGETRTNSFEEAVAQKISGLHGEVKAFRERAPKDPTIKLVLPPGYDPKAVSTPAR